MVEGVAPSRGPIRAMGSEGSPISSAPRCAAMSPRENKSLAALGVERLDHLLGDVDAIAGEASVPEYQVVLLGLEDLLDDLVGALDDGSELLVLALVQVFLEFAAPALDLAVLVDQLALPAAALGF